MKWLKRLYDWVLHWAETPYGTPALFILAFAESSFFPIPPDVLLIALALSIPRRAWYYATVCTIASVIGGLFGYLIGWQMMDLVAKPILAFYGAPLQDGQIIISMAGKEVNLTTWYQQYDAWIVFIAALTPIPYKVITISAGLCRVSIPVFILTSVLGRALRFFAVGGLIRLWGEPAKEFIDRYFDWLAIAFVVLLIGGFGVIKFFF
ncbi:MAG TPA: YqaA family protein [bacterium]|nr:YqaA family protein [bacterium]HQL63803.1 YqaA family protein [bacterium]